MADVTALQLTDTFNTLLTRLNEVITKLNKIEIDESNITINLATSSETEPADSSITLNTGTIYLSNTGALKLKYNIAGSVSTKTVSVS